MRSGLEGYSELLSFVLFDFPEQFTKKRLLFFGSLFLLFSFLEKHLSCFLLTSGLICVDGKVPLFEVLNHLFVELLVKVLHALFCFRQFKDSENDLGVDGLLFQQEL